MSQAILEFVSVVSISTELKNCRLRRNPSFFTVDCSFLIGRIGSLLHRNNACFKARFNKVGLLLEMRSDCACERLFASVCLPWT